MKRCFFALMLVTMMSFQSAADPIRKGHLPQDFDPKKCEPRPLVECTMRDGLPNFYKKIKSGQKEMTVVYFGGSITDQQGYRIQSMEYLQEQYPGVKFNPVNAAIGGTGSMLGALRCGYDVLRHKPDLVFVEFAVNDSSEDPYSILRSMEGIVRQIWTADPHTDIVFVYTITAGQIDDAVAGRTFRSVSADEEVADYYGIPSINMVCEVARLVAEGKMLMKPDGGEMTRVSGEALNGGSGAASRIIFAPDGVHPFPDTGHKLYTESIVRSFMQFAGCARKRAHRIPAPMVSDCIDKVTTAYFDQPGLKLSGDISRYEGGRPELDYFSHLTDFHILKPGAVISFKFRGSDVVMYDIMGPEGVILDVRIDGKPVKEHRRFDPYCTYFRLHSESVAANEDPDVVHDISIKVTDKAIDKRSVLFESSRPAFDQHPEAYAPCIYYCGHIFIVGELVQ